MTDTSAVSSVERLAQRLGRRRCRLIDRQERRRQPRRASALSVLSTASCSMALAMRCRRPVGFERLGDAAQGEIVGLGAAAGEDDLGRLGADQRRHRRPRLVQHRFGPLPEMVDARRVAELVAQSARHRLDDWRGRPAWWRCGRNRSRMVESFMVAFAANSQQ